MSAKKYNIRTSVKFLDNLNLIARCLGILPSSQLRGYYLGLFVIVVDLACFSYSVYGKLVVWPAAVEQTVHFVNVVLDMVTILLNLTVIVWVNFVRRGAFFKFYKNFLNVDHYFLHKSHLVGWSNSRYYFEVIFAHILFAVIGLYDGSVWCSSIGLQMYKYYMLVNIQNYQILILVLVLRFYALSIAYRFEALNNVLRKIKKLEEKECHIAFTQLTDQETKVLFADEYWSVRRATKVYFILAKLVDEFNECFGLCYIPLYIWTIVSILRPVNIALVYGPGETQLADLKFGATLVTMCLAWCLLPLVFCFGVVSACELGVRQANRTSNICYYLMNHASTNGKDMLKAELLQLADQSSNAKPTFSASGFFNISYQVVFSMVGSVSSYVIVLVQFHK